MFSPRATARGTGKSRDPVLLEIAGPVLQELRQFRRMRPLKCKDQHIVVVGNWHQADRSAKARSDAFDVRGISTLRDLRGS